MTSHIMKHDSITAVYKPAIKPIQKIFNCVRKFYVVKMIDA